LSFRTQLSTYSNLSLCRVPSQLWVLPTFLQGHNFVRCK
jgi:hypothetical protein